MKEIRLYTAQTLAAETEVQLEDRAGQHLQVLRATTGQAVTLFNGDGRDYAASVSHCKPWRLSVHSALPGLPIPGLRVRLAQAISKGERMDYAIQKATELGVAEIIPLWSERVEVRLDKQRLEKKIRHWQGVVSSACEQCGRADVPSILTPCNLPQLQGPGIYLHPKATQPLLQRKDIDNPITLAIGPEGGFSDKECLQLSQAGFTGSRLGPRVLRTETAPVVALSLLMAGWGDLN